MNSKLYRLPWKTRVFAWSTRLLRSPMISVILPAFNAEATIAQAIESVLAQSWRDFELIVINDGSTDATLQAVAAFDDSRLAVFSHANRGPSASRNVGVSLANGEYVAFIDADDIWLSHKLEVQVSALQADPQADVAYGWTDTVDPTGCVVYPDQRRTVSGDVYETLLLHNFISSGSNTMISRKVFQEVGGFDESLWAVEDWDLHVRLAARYAYVCVPTVVVQYRLSHGSLSSQLRLMEASHRRVAARLFAAAPPHLQRLRTKCDAAFFRYLAVRATQCGSENQPWLAAARLAILSFRSSPATSLYLWAQAGARGSASVLSRVVASRTRHQRRSCDKTS